MQQTKEKHGCVQLTLPERTVPFEVAVETTLPDYRSEISRLLWARPTLTPPERFIGGGKAEFSGKILLEILYTGPDGVLYGADHEGGYSFTVPLEGAFAIEGAEVLAEPVVDAVISRVTGPRRLAVRCRCHALVRGVAEKSLHLETRGIPENTQPHLLCEAAEVGHTILGGREELLLSDSLACEEDLRVLGARGSVFLPEVHAGSDEVCASGEVLITLLCCSEKQQRPSVLEKRIPFDGRIALEGVHPDHRVCVSGTVGRIELSREDGRIALSPQLILVAEAQSTKPITLCRDAFVPGYKAEYRFEEFAAHEDAACCSRHLSISAERDAGELGMGDETEIIDHTCEAEICEKSTENGKTVWIGRLQCHLLCCRGGELCTQDATLPFRLVPGVGSENAQVDCRVASTRVRLHAGMLRADAELQLCIRDTRTLPLRALCEITLTPQPPVPRAAIELYYPACSESLWDVAKKYGMAPDALADANGLDADSPNAKSSLAGKCFLLIP